MMAEVEKLGRVDPRAQAQLLEELKRVDPSLWPMTVQTVWSRVAYVQRYGKQSNARQLADRRSTTAAGGSAAAGGRREIDLHNSYPSTNPTTYPTTGAVSELSSLHIGVPAYPSTNGGRTNGPSVQPRRDNGRPQDIRATPREPGGGTKTPPWPNSSGAALKRVETDCMATAQKERPQGVIHTSYHGSPSEPREPRKLSLAQDDDARADVANKNGSGKASPSPKRSDDWRTHIDSAIVALESRLESKGEDTASGGKTDASDHAHLRIMQLLAGRRNDALSDMPIDDAAVRDFWSNEIFGLDILLDTQRFSRDSQRATEAKRHLCEAVAALGEAATLEIRNLAFCSEVLSYGSIKRFESREFSPGQQLLLYAEIDNFHSENTAKGYHTSLRSSFQIFDSSGRRIDKRESTTSEEHCQSLRRDYFIGCDFRLPAKIYPGRHTLKLTVEDLKSHKVAESSIDFTVKEPK